MRALQADALGDALVTDPLYKAGQDPGSADIIADALAVRAAKGPSLNYIGDLDNPVQLGNTASGETVYGDTIEVTDAKYLFLAFALFLDEDGGAASENVNVGIGLESSLDGINWFPVAVIDRVNVISPSTLFRDDDGQTSGAPSTTGGFADASTTQNAPLLEDVVAVVATPLSATTDPFVFQRAVRFNVEYEHYVRVFFCPIYSEPPDFITPSIAAVVAKAS